MGAAKAHGSPGPVSGLARRYGFSYPLDRARPRGAVLAWHPDARSLRRATDLALGSALVVVESGMTPLAGWAAAAGAVDISGVYPDTPTLDPEVRRALDSAVRFGGRKNWTGRYEREHARGALDPVMRGGLIDVDIAVSYALAHAGVSELGAKNLRAILERPSR